MNQTRRTLLQAILGLFSLGVTKAVAKSRDSIRYIGSEADVLRIKNAKDGDVLVIQPQFDEVVGVVFRGGRCDTATIGLDGANRRTTTARGVDAATVARCLAWSCHESNAMIFAEFTDLDGQELVAELKKLCPERVYRRHKGEPYLPGVPPTVAELLRQNDWSSDDPDQAYARFLAITGKKLLAARQSPLAIRVYDGVPAERIYFFGKDGFVRHFDCEAPLSGPNQLVSLGPVR